MFTEELLSLMIRVTLLLAAGYLVARVLEWTSAAMAHCVLVMTLAGSLAIPMIAEFAPRWQWTQPAWMSFTGGEIAKVSAATGAIPSGYVTIDPLSDRIGGIDTDDAVDAKLSTDVDLESIEFTDWLESRQAEIVTPANATESRLLKLTALPRAVESSRFAAAPSWTWPERGVVIWLLVASLLICRLIYSLLRLSGFVKSCPLATAQIAGEVEAVATELGMNRRVRIVLSMPDAMPMACWYGHWIIVLPSNFMTWSKELRETTLVHELGHIARRDAWSDMLVQIVCCVLWLNPISWMSVRDVRRLRERACDEWALQKSAINVKTYAECLLEVVQRCHTQQLRFSSTMAGKKDFESRLRWLMSASRPRTAKPVATASIVLAVATMGLAIATAEPTLPQLQTTSAAPEKAKIAAADSPTVTGPVEKLNEVIVSKDPSPTDPAISVAGIVTDTDGKPLVGMQVVLRGKIAGSFSYAFTIQHVRDVLARTTTNTEGRFAFSRIGIPPRMIDAIADLRAGKAGAELVVWGEGKALTWQPVESFENAEQHIRLTPEADVSGTVVDAEDNPVDDAELRVTGLTRSTTDPDAFMRDPGDHNLHSSEIQFSTRVKHGRFKIPNMPQDYRVLVHCCSATGKRGFAFIDTGKENFETAKFRNGDSQGVKVQRTPVAVVVQQLPWIRIRVLDHDGNPVSGGGIEAVTEQRGYGGNAEVGSDGNTVLIVHEPGVHEITYAQDPLTPAVGLTQTVDIQTTESQVVEMKLVPSKLLIGKVLDDESGAPITGAYVQSGNAPVTDKTMPLPASAMAVTDTDGVFRLPVVAGDCKLYLRHDIDGYFAKTEFDGSGPTSGSPGTVDVTVTEDNVPSDVVIKLGRGLVINGVLADIEGRPQAGAIVKAENDGSPPRRATTLTDESGRFQFVGFSPYSPVQISSWTESGSADQLIYRNNSDKFAERLTENVQLEMFAGSTLTGRVIQNENPVQGALVRLTKSLPHNEVSNKFQMVSEKFTDEHGNYKFNGLFKGDQYQIEVDAPEKGELRDWGYQFPYSPVVNAQHGATIELPDAELVKSSQQLRGMVVDPDGNPVSGVTVMAKLASGGKLSLAKKNGQMPQTNSDDKGQFHLMNLPEESIELMVYRANPAGGNFHYGDKVCPGMNATDIRIVFDPKLGSDVEDLDAK